MTRLAQHPQNPGGGTLSLPRRGGTRYGVVASPAPRQEGIMLSRTHLVAVLAALLLSGLAAVPGATAQTWPTRTITIVVPFPAGGPTDQLARQLGPRFSAKFGQNVVIENVTGGASNIGTLRVARAAPDGYTLLLHNLQMAANATLYPNLGYSTEKDLALVGLVNRNPLVLVGKKSLPPNDLAGLLDWMKTNIAKFALPGPGTTAHLTTALFVSTLGVNADLIPYRGAAPAIQDVIGEQVDLSFPTPQQVLPMIEQKMLKAYGVTAKQPMAQLRGVAGLAEKLGPQLDVVYWQGVFAPAGTPAAILDRLGVELQDAVVDVQLLKEWAAQGLDPFPKAMATHAGGNSFYLGEIARWRDVIRKNNIRVN
jgi:tripartite-type tricarboxylate transporter receptor subunit TctC